MAEIGALTRPGLRAPALRGPGGMDERRGGGGRRRKRTGVSWILQGERWGKSRAFSTCPSVNMTGPKPAFSGARLLDVYSRN
jgi:hypothetical protein